MEFATCLQITTDVGPVLLISVYMPTNYNDDQSLHVYIDMCSKLNAIIVETDAIHTIIAGDFNCQEGSRFYNEFSNLANENNLIKSDIMRLKNVFTYLSDNGQNSSWLDHILCSPVLDSLITNVSVLTEVITSDHKPLQFTFSCSMNCMDVDDIYHPTLTQTALTPNWQSCDNDTLALYNGKLDVLLRSIKVLLHLFTQNMSTIEPHKADIDMFYNNIILYMQSAVKEAIPHNKARKGISDFNIPGWNEYIADKHEIARDAFKQWMIHGKPKNSVYKISNNKATSHVASVGGATGNYAIANMWKDHFHEVYNSHDNTHHKSAFEQKVQSICLATDTFEQIIINDVAFVMKKQKKGKAAGPNGLCMESFIFGGPSLHVVLCIFLNLCLTYGYLPSSFCEATIIPLVKSKIGDLTNVNNYRAIAISPAMSKIFESILLYRIESHDDADDYQFGFKSHHSTMSCTHYQMANGIFRSFWHWERCPTRWYPFTILIQILHKKINCRGSQITQWL